MISFLLGVAALTLLFPVLALVSYKLNVAPTLRKSYVFWAAFSLLNFPLLAWLPIPPILLLEGRHGESLFGRFLPFLAPPVGFTLAAVGLGLAIVKLRRPSVFASPSWKTWSAYIVNATFLVLFLIAADLYKSYLISQALKGRKPDCIVVQSFFSSVLSARQTLQLDAHAFFNEGGKDFCWSYSRRTFFPGNESLDRNFQCQRGP